MSYYVREIRASSGYYLCDGSADKAEDGIHEVYVEEEDETYTIKCQEPVAGDLIGLTLTKVQEDTVYNSKQEDSYLSYLNEYLPDMSGAQFTVKYYDGQYTDMSEVEESHLKRTWVIEAKARCDVCGSFFDDRDSCLAHMSSEHGGSREDEISYIAELTDQFLVSGSDPLYYASSGEPVLPLGTVTVEETESAWGYLTTGSYIAAEDGSLIDSPNGRILMNVCADYAEDEAPVDSGGQLTVNNIPGNEVKKIEQLRRCSITIHKKDGDGRDCKGVEYALAILNIDTGEYEYIASYNGTASCANTEGLSYKNDDGVVVTATDEGGTVTFSNLVFGTYIVTETRTGNGLSLLANNFTVELPYVSDNVKDASVPYSYYDEETGLYYWADLTYEIEDGVIFDIPQSGGEKGVAGTAIVGVCLVFLGLLYAKRRKKNLV